MIGVIKQITEVVYIFLSNAIIMDKLTIKRFKATTLNILKD